MKKVVVVVGHSFYEKGAVNKKINIHEYDLCMKVALNLFSREKWKDIDLILKSRNSSYIELPKEINSLNPDYIIELHLNSVSDENIQGSEHLYFHSSIKGKKIAEVFQKNCVDIFKLKNRGILPRKKGERGSEILEKTNAPCIITEPFFISNLSNQHSVDDYIEKYIKYIQKSIREIVDIGI